MTKDYLWTASRARLRLFRVDEGKNLHWLFLPGGPGLGSESLIPLLEILNIPGTMWLLDLPGDGSNRTSTNKEAFSRWAEGLVEAVDALKNVILVGHSRGGMFALAAEELQKKLKGLVLMTSAPDMSWQKEISLPPLPEADQAEEIYRRNPNNSDLKKCILAGAPRMFFTKKGLEEGVKFFSQLPYNYETWQWAEEHFDPAYRAKWIPKDIPTLILSGEKDIAIPIKYFAGKPEFQRNNILLKEIENAGHFPWMDNPLAVIAAFDEYVSLI